EPVPEGVPVRAGAAITYSYDQWGLRTYDTVWGIFPDVEEDETHFLFYDCQNNQWHYAPDPGLGYYLEHTAITFQWMEGGVVFVVGMEDGEDPVLYWYPLAGELWESDAIDEFDLGPRPGLAFRANPTYNIEYEPIPGWLYCLPGNSQQFWRYWIPCSFKNPVTVDGIYPGDGAMIADQTPVFIWEETPEAIEYRLVVATDPNFFTTIIDVTTATPQYQVETEMENGTYYWKTASRSSSSTWNWSEVHTVTIQGGWEQLPNIPEAIYEGAALAYEKQYYWGDECLIAFVGGEKYSCYRYRFADNEWVNWHNSQDQYVGSAIATHKGADRPFAVFGANPETDRVWRDHLHFGWSVDPRISPLPEILGPGASIALSKIYNETYAYLYLIVGEDANGNPRNSFYRHIVTIHFDEQEQGNRSQGAQGKQRQTLTQAKAQISSKGIILEYQLDALANVKVMVYDALGRQVQTLFSGYQSKGIHRLEWSPEASGAYFILLDIGKEQAKLKVVVR
ncbi:MAG: DUF4962 domain-containing protein, partial [candidate division WOR-3 bacterium]